MNDTVRITSGNAAETPSAFYAESGAIQTDSQADKKKTGFRAGDTAAALVSLLLGWLFCRSFLFGGAALGSAIFTLAAYALGLVWLKRADKLSAKTIALSLPLPVYAAAMLTNANETMRYFAGFCAMIYYVVWLASAFSAGKNGDIIKAKTAVKALFISPYTRFGKVFGAISQGGRGQLRLVGAAIAGLAAAVVPLCFVMTQLSGADEKFGSLAEKLFDGISERSAVILISLMLGIPVAMYIFGLLFSSREGISVSDKPGKTLPSVFGVFLCAPVLLVYIVFFATQIPYYLSAFGGRLPEGYSMSSYAVKGFFELTRVSALNGILCLILLKTDASAKASAITRRALVTLLGVSALMLLATAASKLYLYTESYGLTRRRVYAAYAMVFIAALFVAVLLRQYISRIDLFAAAVAISVAVSFAAVLPDIDGVIAKSQVDRCIGGKQAELYELDALSDSPNVERELLRLCSSEQISESLRDDCRKNLVWRSHRLKNSSGTLYIYDFNISEAVSAGVLKENGF
ncbi:MAG: DUF4153 domain-containing protein [Eubacteriales bacterium]|jgi:hypothetical protein